MIISRAIVNKKDKDKTHLASFMSKWNTKCSCGKNFLLGILYWTGLLANSGRRYITVCLFFIAYTVISMGASVQTLDLGSDFVSRLVLIHVSSCLLSSFTWLSMTRKTNLLSKFLGEIHPFSLTKSQTFCLIFILALPFIMVTGEVVKPKEIRIIKIFDTFYSFKVDYYWQIILSLIQSYMSHVIYPLWTNMMAFLYCLVCQRVSAMLSDLTARIQNYTPEKFTAIQQKDVLKHQSRLADVVELLQKTFSVPSFLLSVAHFTNCIMVVAIMVDKFFKGMKYVFFTQWIVMTTNSFGGLLVCLWMAGRLPMEAQVFHEAFRKNIRQRLLLVDQKDEICFEKKLVRKSNFVLSGCGIISFNRSSIAALAGTILTYAILLISKG